MLITTTRILIGAILAPLFLLLLACAAIVDLFETSRPAQHAMFDTSPDAEEFASRSDEALTEVTPS